MNIQLIKSLKSKARDTVFAKYDDIETEISNAEFHAEVEQEFVRLIVDDLAEVALCNSHVSGWELSTILKRRFA